MKAAVAVAVMTFVALAAVLMMLALVVVETTVDAVVMVAVAAAVVVTMLLEALVVVQAAFVVSVGAAVVVVINKLLMRVKLVGVVTVTATVEILSATVVEFALDREGSTFLIIAGETIPPLALNERVNVLTAGSAGSAGFGIFNYCT